ncbi:MAG: O-antigen ligase family protein [Actinomycetota bacterium]|nr:O-antigen ligase family protein [Actinomycetota bacterium]
MRSRLVSQWLFFGFMAMAAIVPVTNLSRFADGILTKDAAFIILLCVMAVTWAFASGRTAYIDRQLWLILIFLGLVGVSTLVSTDMYTSLVGAYRHWEGATAYIALALTYFLALQVDWDDDKIKKLISVLVAVAAAISILALWKSGHKLILLKDINRERESFFGPNAFSFFLIMVWPLAIRLFLASTKKLEKTFMLFACFFIFGGNVVTASRSGWVISVVIFLATVFITGNKKKIMALTSAVILIVFLAVLASKSLAHDFNFSGRFMSIFQSESIAPRVALWRESIRLIADKPLTGYGPDSYGLEQIKYEELRVAQFQSKPRTAHNYALNVGSTLGLPALLILAIIFFQAVFDGFKSGDYLLQTLSLSLVTAMLLGLTLEWHPFLMVFFWLFMGVNSARKVTAGAGTAWIKSAVVVASAVLVLWLAFVVGADFYYRRGLRTKEREAKIAYFDRAVKINPYVFEYWDKRIKAGVKRSDSAQLALIRKARAYQPRREELLLVEVTLKKRRHLATPAEMLSIVDKALKIRPLSGQAHYLRGRLLMEEKRFAEAESEFATVIRLKPNDKNYLARVSKAREELNREQLRENR